MLQYYFWKWHVCSNTNIQSVQKDARSLCVKKNQSIRAKLWIFFSLSKYDCTVAWKIHPWHLHILCRFSWKNIKVWIGTSKPTSTADFKGKKSEQSSFWGNMNIRERCDSTFQLSLRKKFAFLPNANLASNVLSWGPRANVSQLYRLYIYMTTGYKQMRMNICRCLWIHFTAWVRMDIVTVFNSFCQIFLPDAVIFLDEEPWEQCVVMNTVVEAPTEVLGRRGRG